MSDNVYIFDYDRPADYLNRECSPEEAQTRTWTLSMTRTRMRLFAPTARTWIGIGLLHPRRRVVRSLRLALFGSGLALVGVPRVARGQARPDPLQPVLDSTMQQYMQAASRADSLHYADSALALTQVMLQRDSLQPWALLTRAKLLKARGDSAGEYRALSTLGRGKPAYAVMAWADVGARDAWAAAKAQGILQLTLPDSAPQRAIALRVILYVAGLARDWSAVVTFAPALAGLDSTTADVALGAYAVLLTAYYMLDQPAQASALLSQVAARFPTAGPPRQWYGRALLQLQERDSTLLQVLVPHAAGNAVLAEAAFHLAVAAQAWPHVATLGTTVAQLDSAALDSAGYAMLLTAYEHVPPPPAALTVAEQAAARFPGMEVNPFWRHYAMQLRRTAPGSPAALLVLLQQLLRPHAGDTAFGHRLLAGFTAAKEWAVVIAAGQALAGATPVVDTAVLRYTFVAYGAGGRSREAGAFARALVRRHPRDLGVVRAVVSALATARDLPNLITFGRLLIAADRTVADTPYFRLLYSCGDPQRAAVAVEAVLHAYPRTPRVLSGAVAAFDRARDWPRVVRWGRVLAAVEPAVLRERPYRLTLAVAYDRLHQPRNVADMLAPVTAAAPADVTLWLWYAQALRQAGRPRAAVVLHAFQLDRDNPRITDAALWLWYARELRLGGYLPAAREAIQRAVALAPGDPAVRAEQHRLAGR